MTWYILNLSSESLFAYLVWARLLSWGSGFLSCMPPTTESHDPFDFVNIRILWFLSVCTLFFDGVHLIYALKIGSLVQINIIWGTDLSSKLWIAYPIIYAMFYLDGQKVSQSQTWVWDWDTFPPFPKHMLLLHYFFCIIIQNLESMWTLLFLLCPFFNISGNLVSSTLEIRPKVYGFFITSLTSHLR